MSFFENTDDGIRATNYFLPYLDKSKMTGNFYVNRLAAKPGDEDYIILCPGQVRDESYEDRYASNKGWIGLVGDFVAPDVEGYADVDEPIIDRLKLECENVKGIGFEWCGKKSNKSYNAKDAFRILNLDGLKTFLGIIEEECSVKVIHTDAKKGKRLYNDVKEIVTELVNTEQKCNIADLCARWGKTKTFMEVGEVFNEIE